MKDTQKAQSVEEAAIKAISNLKLDPNTYFGIQYQAYFISGAQWQQSQSDLVSKWIPCNDDKNIPIGNWLFALEKAIGGEVIHTGNKNERFIIVSGKFSWDVPKIIAYTALPQPPQI